MERIGLAPGAEIGGYTIVAPLGSGGMGTVYRAVDGGGSPVALKLLHPHVGADAAARERLRREVAALQRLRHPGVAAVLDAEADSTEAFLVTALVSGDTLEEHVRERGPLDAADLLDLAEGLRDALAAVHAAGVVHRDLKPSNVLLGDDGPVLIDFGIAQAADDHRVTSTGLVVGTPGYMAPELLDGGEPSPATDLWGWAAVLAFAASGRPPFGIRPLEAVLARASSGEVDLAGVGPLTARALRGALVPDPAARTAADDVVAALTVVAAEGEPPEQDEVTQVLAGADARGTVALTAAPADDGVARDGRTVAVPTGPGGVLGAGGTGAAVVGETTVLPAGGTAVLPIRGAVGALPDEDTVPGYVGPPAGPSETEADQDLLDAAGPDDGDPDTPWSAVGLADTDRDEAAAEDAEGSGYVRPPARRRWGSLLALALLTAAAGARYPGLTVLAVVAVLLVVRTAGSTVEAMHTRRERVGVRRSDGARAAATTPWHLLRSALGLVPSLVVGASVMVIVLGIAWWLIGSGRWVVGESRSGGEPEGVLAGAVVGVVVLLGVLTVWWGPLSRMSRIGARRVLAGVAPGRVGALVVVLVALAGTAVCVVQLLSGADIVWTPLPEPTLP